MMAHKNQYKCEHINWRAKSSVNIEPIYLHTPERIESLLFLFKMALQNGCNDKKEPQGTILKNQDSGSEKF